MRPLARVTGVQRGQVLGEWVAHGGRRSDAVSRSGLACSSDVIVVLTSCTCRLRCRGDGQVSGEGSGPASSHWSASVLVLEKLQLIACQTRSFSPITVLGVHLLSPLRQFHAH